MSVTVSGKGITKMNEVKDDFEQYVLKSFGDAAIHIEYYGVVKGGGQKSIHPPEPETEYIVLGFPNEKLLLIYNAAVIRYVNPSYLYVTGHLSEELRKILRGDLVLKGGIYPYYKKETDPELHEKRKKRLPAYAYQKIVILQTENPNALNKFLADPEQYIVPSYGDLDYQKELQDKKMRRKLHPFDRKTIQKTFPFLPTFCKEKCKRFPRDISKEMLYIDGERRKIVTSRAERSSEFREKVLHWDKLCHVCGCGNQIILEAAHIIAVKDFGSDDERNGMCLCRNHHKMFDAGQLSADWIMQHRAKKICDYCSGESCSVNCVTKERDFYVKICN